MLEQALAKCLCVFFFIFSMYPSSTILKAEPSNDNAQNSEVESLKSPWGFKYDDILRFKRGFDLNDEDYKKFNIWDKGEIPFYIDIPSFHDKALRDKIRWFLNQVNALTSLNFMELPRPPKDTDGKRWVYFLNRASHLPCQDVTLKNFTGNGIQRVVLGYDCLTNIKGLAEIVLALAGVPPQHNAPDRDDYISINKDNIRPEKKYLFQKLNDKEWIFHDLKYDSESAGHFDSLKHTVNGLPTIKSDSNINKPLQFLGHDEGFSSLDIIKLNLLYNHVKTRKNKLPACRKIYSSLKKCPSVLRFKPVPKPGKYLGIQESKVTGTPTTTKTPTTTETTTTTKTPTTTETPKTTETPTTTETPPTTDKPTTPTTKKALRLLRSHYGGKATI